MPMSYLHLRIALACLTFLCVALKFPCIGRAQTEQDVAKQIEAAHGIVFRDFRGSVEGICLRPERAADFNDVDFSVFKNLKDINVCGPYVTDKLLARLQAIPPGLETLDFFLAPVSDDGLAGLLRKQKSLKLVRLWATPITDKSLGELGKLEEMRTLYLNETKITDNGLKCLAKSQLVYLDLTKTEISDVGLRELNGIGALRSLLLEGTRVTDAGIQGLAGNKNLRLLGVESTGVTENGKMLLKATLPNLTYFKYQKKPERK